MRDTADGARKNNLTGVYSTNIAAARRTKRIGGGSTFNTACIVGLNAEECSGFEGDATAKVAWST